MHGAEPIPLRMPAAEPVFPIRCGNAQVRIFPQVQWKVRLPSAWREIESSAIRTLQHLDWHIAQLEPVAEVSREDQRLRTIARIQPDGLGQDGVARFQAA